MSDIIAKKIKKYLFFISTFFFIVLGAHLVYLYVYDEAKSEAIKGGSISEAIIGSFPHFNPLLASNDHNTYINRLLYRSILEYSTKTQSLESDLMSCNLENLLSIECSLENNLQWSDGSKITTEDIVATLNIIKETKVNPIIASLLEDTSIASSEDSISFTRKKKDLNILYVFMQPILPKDAVEKLNSENVNGKFSEIGALYSGRFRLININQDDTIGVTKLTLGRNDTYFENPNYVDFLILNLYRDESHFLKNKNNFNIFNDKNTLVGGSIPRLDDFSYSLPQFTANFFNTETLPKELRRYISAGLKRENIIASSNNTKLAPALNPFLDETRIDPEGSPLNIESYLAKKGFFSKKKLLKGALAEEEKMKAAQKAEQNLISAEAPIQPIKVEKKKPVQSSLSYITSPTNKKYNFISEDNILITGKVDAGVDSVYINDYKLNGFTTGDDVFYYRLLESYDSIAPGENRYKVYYATGKEKKLVEEFVYIYEQDTEKLQKIQESFFAETKNEEQIVNTPTQENETATLSGGTNTSSLKNTPKLDGLSSSAIQELSDAFYYDTKGKPYSLKLIYSKEESSQVEAAEALISQIENLGIKVEIEAMNLGDITSGLRSESLSYDMMLLGINLGFLKSDIFPYFHSSQVKNGYNISNFKKLSLDILLEELKGNKLSKTKQNELITKILAILKEEIIIHTLYTPKIDLLIDKNIKNFTLPEFLPDMSYRYFPLTESYLSEKKMIQIENKSIGGYWDYIYDRLLGK